MAFFSQEKKQQKLIMILTVVIVAIFITIYFGLIRPKSGAPPTAPAGGIAGGVVPDKSPAVAGNGEIEDINFLFLQDPRFLELKKYGEWPIKPRETGRDNPFEPFEGYSERGPGEVVEEEIIEEEIVEDIEEILEEETLEEVIIEEVEDEESIERATIEELLRLLNEE